MSFLKAHMTPIQPSLLADMLSPQPLLATIKCAAGVRISRQPLFLRGKTGLAVEIRKAMRALGLTQHEAAKRTGDELISRCQLWAASNYRVEAPVMQMVERSGLPERTFKRRFQLATGTTPLEYIHTRRIEEAKQMLEASDVPIEAIAAHGGISDYGLRDCLLAING